MFNVNVLAVSARSERVMYIAEDVAAACLMARGVNQKPYGTKPLYIVELPDGSRMTINDQKNYLKLFSR